MEKNVAEIILEYGGELREDYSGLSKFGERTTGIIFEDEKEFFNALGEIMINGDELDCEAVGVELKELRSDNIGMRIIYY